MPLTTDPRREHLENKILEAVLRCATLYSQVNAVEDAQSIERRAAMSSLYEARSFGLELKMYLDSQRTSEQRYVGRGEMYRETIGYNPDNGASNENVAMRQLPSGMNERIPDGPEILETIEDREGE